MKKAIKRDMGGIGFYSILIASGLIFMFILSAICGFGWDLGGYLFKCLF